MVVYFEGQDALGEDALARVLWVLFHFLIVGNLTIFGGLLLVVACELNSGLISGGSSSRNNLGPGIDDISSIWWSKSFYASARAPGFFVLVCEPDVSCCRSRSSLLFVILWYRDTFSHLCILLRVFGAGVFRVGIVVVSGGLCSLARGAL